MLFDFQVGLLILTNVFLVYAPSAFAMKQVIRTKNPIAFATPSPRSRTGQRFHVVLDPGHGGSDTGTCALAGFLNTGPTKVKNASAHMKAMANQICEKDVSLLIALQAADELQRVGYQVSLTRNTDVDVPLPDRTRFANKVKGDIFVSIHLNSGVSGELSSHDAQGIETFILDSATDATSIRLSELENKGLHPAEMVPGIDKDVTLILKDLRLERNRTPSLKLAKEIQESLLRETEHYAMKISPLGVYKTKIRPLRNRGVKQALFYVLIGADMPAILTEIGFLASPLDQRLLLSQPSQHAYSTAIRKAVDVYYRKHVIKTASFSKKKRNIARLH